MAPDLGTGGVERSALLSGARFRHGFTTRTGSLAAAGFDAASVYAVEQVHGSTVVVASGEPSALRSTRADAIVLEAGAAGAVRVADCVPVLVGDETSGRAAAVHAGWRGVVSGVLPAALSTMRARPGKVVAAIGPSIGPCCFEVGEDVAEQIALAVPAPRVIARRATGKAWVDLRVAVRAQLLACGVPGTRVDDVGGCTRCDSARYHSFRRDGAASGRMLGVIAARAAGSG